MTDIDTPASERMLDGVGPHIRQALEGIVGPASPSAVFSEPRSVGHDLIFTAVAWERGGGFGFGAGQGAEGDADTGFGSGGGGGAGSQGRPVAVIRVGPGGIEVRPVVDVTKIGLTVLVAAIGAWRAMRRRR